jgi:hypothetical protein
MSYLRFERFLRKEWTATTCGNQQDATPQVHWGSNAFEEHTSAPATVWRHRLLAFVLCHKNRFGATCVRWAPHGSPRRHIFRSSW